MKESLFFVGQRVVIFTGLLFVMFGGIPLARAALLPLGAQETIENITAGVDDQRAEASTTFDKVGPGRFGQTVDTQILTENRVAIPASLTLTIGEIMPVASSTFTIGDCPILFSLVELDDFDCNGGGVINVSNHANRAELISALTRLTNLTDGLHGLLEATSTDTAVTYTRVGPETDQSSISYQDGTGGLVVTTSVVTSFPPVAKQQAVHLSSIPEPGDIFSISVGDFEASYIVQAGDTTNPKIVDGLNGAIKIALDYESQPFVSSTSSGSRIILTAKTPGIPFSTATATATNRPAVGQQTFLVFTGTVEAGDTYFFQADQFTARYLVTASDTVRSDIARGLNTAIQIASGYANQHFTTAVQGDVVVLTATDSGVLFPASVTAENHGPTVQTVLFSPPSVVVTGETLTLTLQDKKYSYLVKAGDMPASVIDNFVLLSAFDPQVYCRKIAADLICRSLNPGQSFTYSVGMIAPPSQVVESGSGGVVVAGLGNSSGSGESYVGEGKTNGVVATSSGLRPQVLGLSFSTSTVLIQTLRYGDRGPQVQLLQDKLKKFGYFSLATPSTGYFGSQTKAALLAFQVAFEIRPINGVSGTTTRRWLNALAL